jgi:hypothetical protein
LRNSSKKTSGKSRLCFLCSSRRNSAHRTCRCSCPNPRLNSLELFKVKAKLTKCSLAVIFLAQETCRFKTKGLVIQQTRCRKNHCFPNHFSVQPPRRQTSTWLVNQQSNVLHQAECSTRHKFKPKYRPPRQQSLSSLISRSVYSH